MGPVFRVTAEKVESLKLMEEPCEGIHHLRKTYMAVQENRKKKQDKIRKRKLFKGLEETFKVDDNVRRSREREEK